MKRYSAIHLAKIGLAILLSAALNFSIVHAHAHPTEANESVFEKVVFATSLADLDRTTQDQRFSEDGESSHDFNDCHVHIIGLKQAQLVCDQSSVERLPYWTDTSVILATLQGIYRPPRV